MKIFQYLSFAYLTISISWGVDGSDHFDFVNEPLSHCQISLQNIFSYNVNEPHNIEPFKALINNPDLLLGQDYRKQLLERMIAFFDSKVGGNARVPFMLRPGPRTYFAKEYLYKEKNPKNVWENCGLPNAYKILEMKEGGYKMFYEAYKIGKDESRPFYKAFLAPISVMNRPIIKYFRQEVQNWSNIPDSVHKVFQIIIEESFVYCVEQRLLPNTLELTDKEEIPEPNGQTIEDYT